MKSQYDKAVGEPKEYSQVMDIPLCSIESIFLVSYLSSTDFVVFTQLPAVYWIVQESVPITSPGSRVQSYLDGLSVKIDIFYSIKTYKI